MLVKHLDAYTHLEPFLRYSKLCMVENCDIFLPLAFNALVGGVLIGIPGKSMDRRKVESWGYHRQ